jgi:hypothetical protein
MSDSKAEAISAANIGSEIHDACEKSFEYALHGDHPYYLHAHAFQLELARLFPDVTDWISEKSFAHPLGFGGKCDVHSPSTGIVVDIKSKPGDLTDGKRQHYDQNIQLAAYQVGLELVGYAEMSSDSDPDDPLLNKRWPHKFTQCANIFVSRTHPGKVCSHVWDAQDVAYGWSVFEAALELWKRLSRYNPADYIQPCAA